MKFYIFSLFYLSDKEDKATDYVKKTNDLHFDSDSKSAVKERVNFDIETLQKIRLEFMNKITEFKYKFVNLQSKLLYRLSKRFYDSEYAT